MSDEHLQRTFFVGLLLLVTIAFLWLIRGFLQPIFWAVALGIVFYPLHLRVLARLGQRAGIAAGLSTVFTLFVVVIPIVVIAAAVTAEAAQLYQQLRSGNISLAELYTRVAAAVPMLDGLLERVGMDAERLAAQLSSSALTISQFMAGRALALGQDTLRITIFFFLMLYLLFFFLRDGEEMLRALIRALPFGDERERHLLERFAEVSRATIKGTIVVGVVQGTIGGISFALLGINAPALWGVVMALLSIVPALGPALVWIPAAIILLVSGQVVKALILVAVGTLIIGLADNLLRPVLVGRDTRMPDYLILLSTLGGLAGFGLAGVVIGPLIAAFFLSVWQMAAEEFAPESQPAKPTGDG